MLKLPREILKEIYSYCSVRDVANLFESFNITPTQKELNEIAILYNLPYAFTFDTLITFSEEELSMKDRLKRCIKNNDIPSFTRLFTILDIDTDILIADEDRNIFPRPKIAKIVLDKFIADGGSEKDELLEIAISNNVFDTIDILLNKEDIVIEYYYFTYLYNTKEEDIVTMLKVVSTHERYVTEEYDGFWKHLLSHFLTEGKVDIVSFIFTILSDYQDIYLDLSKISNRTLLALVKKVKNEDFLKDILHTVLKKKYLHPDRDIRELRLMLEIIDVFAGNYYEIYNNIEVDSIGGIYRVNFYAYEISRNRLIKESAYKILSLENKEILDNLLAKV